MCLSSFVVFMVIFNLIMLKFYFLFFLFSFDLICLLECFLYFVLFSNYCGISKFYFYVVVWVLILFKELGKGFMSACLTKTSFLVSFWSMVCPLTLGWRAAVFWPCKGSIIISSLIVIWYEWLDEAWSVLDWDLFNWIWFLS